MSRWEGSRTDSYSGLAEERDDPQQDACTQYVKLYVQPPTQVVIYAVDHEIHDHRDHDAVAPDQRQERLPLSAEPDGGLALVAAYPPHEVLVLDDQLDRVEAQARVLRAPAGSVRVLEEVGCEGDVGAERGCLGSGVW